MPWMLSYVSRCARVSALVRSLTATISKSPPRSLAARNTLRPMRPNPLIPTRTLMHLPPDPPTTTTGRQSIDLTAEGVGVGSPRLVGDRQDRAASDGV